ncbi:hypothetical protein DH2020_036085 [Rehmannia glutinosa]|uniref:NAB domain-containing protein n=1 Tax=Rehmannia glutinosa TaxID=99300 RepID=A0ABR0V7S9_REHGL
MAALSHSESRRLYSWWWDSHNSPKNSKWLQENLTDMDAKVKSMIKLIEEDADSFARRAEMYYKKRPELMKLVEEFYRAYRALAERYNHATGELRHAHRTIAKAFPDQVPFELVEDSPSKSLAHERDPHTPEIKFPIRKLFDRDDDFLDDAEVLSESDTPVTRKGGFRQLHEMSGENNEAVSQSSKSVEWRGNKERFRDEVVELSNENQSLKDKVLEETERAGKAESEIQGLKKALSDMQAEKEDVLVKYQHCLEKLDNIEGELDNAQKDSMRLNEKASRAEIEVQTLKEALIQLEAEKNAGMIKHKEYLEKISNLEAESEAQTLKDEISRLELEKESVIHQYKQCLEKISVLENVISVTENEARLFKKQAERAENEVSELKKSLSDLKKEKEASARQYKCCLETISKLEREISVAKEDVNRLNNDVLIGSLKLESAEEKCNLLEMSNLSLRTEAENLAKTIAMKDQVLSEKQDELENLQTHLQDEHLRYAQIEDTLKTLQNLHSRSQDDQGALAVELKNVLCSLKDLEASKNGLEEEMRHVRDENQSLSETNLSSVVSMENMQNEILGLREIKERLEKEVLNHIDFSNSLQHEIFCLKEEIKGLNMSYQAIVEQVEAAGLNPKCLGTSIKSLQDEKEILSKKLENMQELFNEKVAAENSVSEMKSELEGSREEAKALQESCRFIQGEKATLIAEKASLVSQLQAITETMHKLLEKNAVLENSLSTAKIELEGMREKSKGLEEICELLKNERSFLLTERGKLAFKLENVERRLKSMEKRYIGLEKKYSDLENEKNAVHCQVEELKISLSVEKHERTSSKLQSETMLAGLQNQIRFLREENGRKKKEFEEELDKSLKAQFEISILQKFIKDMEEKNCSLIVECQKHVEASKLAEKVISELESESLEQQVESELLLDEIEQLRLSIYQIFRAVETGPDCGAREDKIENERTFVHNILENIEKMKCSVSKHDDDKQLLLVENAVLLTLLQQLESKGMEIESQKVHLEQEIKTMAEKLDMSKNEKDKLQELNAKLKSDVSENHQRALILEAEMENLCTKQVDLRNAYDSLEEAYVRVNRDNVNLLKKFSELKEEKYHLDQHNDAALLECLATANQSEFLRSFGEEKLTELKSLLEDLNRQREMNISLEWEMSVLTEKLELQKAENLLLKDSVHKLEKEMHGFREYSVRMKKDVINGKESLLQTEVKLQAAENLNLKLFRTVDELKNDIQESVRIKQNLEKNILQLSEKNSIQKMETESLRIVKTNLESEIELLREEIEEKIIREETLSTELQEKNNEFELWESEGTAFYFDLQISSIDGILFKNKLQELAGVYRSLENENAFKTSEIEQMKGKICSMESEISGLKSQLRAYAPVVAALRDDLTFLEHNALLQTKLKASRNHEAELSEAAGDGILLEDQTLVSLQNLQMRIKSVGELMRDMNKPTMQRRSNSKKSKDEHSTDEIEQSKPVRCLGRDKHEHSKKKGHANELNDTPKIQKIKTKATEVMKDIPLDRVSNSSSLQRTRKKSNGRTDDKMLELWETAEGSRRDLTIGESLRMSYKMTEKDIVYDQFENVKRKSGPPSIDSDVAVDKLELLSTRSTELNDRRILDRLSSDAEKLENLQTTVQNLRRKLETNKKCRKAAKDVDFETVWEQLLEAEETVEYLVDLNGELVKSVEDCPSPDRKVSPKLKEAVKIRRRKFSEQARKGSERIDRLQLELQKIQYILLKMEDEKKNRVRNKFFRSKTIILRDFIYNGRKNSGKRKKGPLCGCFRPSTSRDGSSSS